MGADIKILKIKKIAQGLLAYVKSDHEANVSNATIEDSFLYRLLYDNKDDDYDFYSEAVSIFTREETNPHKIGVRLMFSKDIGETPLITVREPSKSKGRYNSIGGMSDYEYEGVDSSINDEYRDSNNSVIELMITGRNSLEVTLVAEVLYSLFLSAYETLTHIAGFDLHELSLKELIANNDLVPFPLFIKSIMINCQYETTVPGINSKLLAKAINFNLEEIYYK